MHHISPPETRAAHLLAARDLGYQNWCNAISPVTPVSGNHRRLAGRVASPFAAEPGFRPSCGELLCAGPSAAGHCIGPYIRVTLRAGIADAETPTARLIANGSLRAHGA
ncbi:protein of unknown function (plasmid) [Pararobbsia alpina]